LQRHSERGTGLTVPAKKMLEEVLTGRLKIRQSVPRANYYHRSEEREEDTLTREEKGGGSGPLAPYAEGDGRSGKIPRDQRTPSSGIRKGRGQ